MTIRGSSETAPDQRDRRSATSFLGPATCEVSRDTPVSQDNKASLWANRASGIEVVNIFPDIASVALLSVHEGIVTRSLPSGAQEDGKRTRPHCAKVSKHVIMDCESATASGTKDLNSPSLNHSENHTVTPASSSRNPPMPMSEPLAQASAAHAVGSQRSGDLRGRCSGGNSHQFAQKLRNCSDGLLSFR